MQSGLGLTRNRHGNQFHARIHIPKDLVPALGRAEMRLSLGTEQRREAIRSAHLIQARKIPAFDELRAEMNKNNPIPTPEQQEEARNRLLTLIKQRQQAQPIPDHDEAAEAAQYASDADEYAAEAARQQKAREQREQAAAFKPDDVHALMVLREESDNENAQLRAALQASEAAKDAALQVAAQYINETKAAQQQAERTKTVAIAIGQRAAQLQTERVAERARIATEHASQIADVSMAALARSGTQASQITDAVLEAMTKAQELPKVQFSELVKDYEDNKTGLTDSSKNQYLKAARAFMSTMGDMYICDISRKTIREFLDIENDMPPNKNGSNRFKNLSRREAAEINKKEEGKTVDIKTSTEHVLKVQAFFTWGLENSANPDKWGFTKYGNPCRKCKDNIFTADEREMLESTTKTRRIFSNEDLTKLFTGKMRSIDRLYGYGIKRFRGRYHYWLPLLALFTGARANELAQLRLSDIVEKDGIMCIDINAGEDIDGMRRKSTKTVKTSVRLVPIHSDLIALGFLDYVEELRSTNHWCLFQEMDPQDVTRDSKTYDYEMVKWFINYRRACDVVENEEGKAVFHSFRHTMASKLLSAAVPEYVVNGILGHAQSSMTTRQYMILETSTLRGAIENMKLPRDVFSLIPKWEDVKPRFITKMPSPAKIHAAPAKKKREMR